MPRFLDTIPNITQTVGEDALLTCNVEQLNGYKVIKTPDEDFQGKESIFQIHNVKKTVAQEILQYEVCSYKVTQIIYELRYIIFLRKSK